MGLKIITPRKWLARPVQFLLSKLFLPSIPFAFYCEARVTPLGFLVKFYLRLSMQDTRILNKVPFCTF